MLGMLLAGAWFLGDSATFALLQPSSSFSASSTPAIIPESGAVAVVDQRSGNTVIVASVTVPPPGVWVAVREVNGNALGNVLGAARALGPKTDFSIPLLRPTEPNRSYAVQLYRDDGSVFFSPAINSVYVDFETSARVVEYFSTTD